MPIEYLDGRRFRRVVIAGADWVRHRREQIDRINVFPVADGDTGTNMALSLAATATAVRRSDARSLAEVADEAAQASILGAKGNSGVILAHWFVGLARALRGRERAGVEEISQCLEAAARSVHAALERPVEGTIVTVMQAVAERARRLDTGKDFKRLLESLHAAAQEALARTPEQLPMLREAGVVDAGAQGYVHFLEGALRAVRGKPLPAGTVEALDVGPAHPPQEVGADSERYCTEVVVRGRGFDDAKLRRHFRGMGSSMLVVSAGEHFKLHVHTDHPDEVMRAAARLGEIIERKVDDMHRQREERGHASGAPLIAFERQPPTVAVLCDSTADLPRTTRAEFGIEMASLQVLFGDRVFRDQVDLETDEFYRMLETERVHPTTSQPPPRSFVEALGRIRPDREAIVVTVSRALSGTHESARSGARLASQPRVEVFDSQSASLGLGMMTLNAARLAASGADADTILEWLGRWRDDTGLVFTVATLEYLRRGGRIGAAKSLLGGLLGLRPVLGFREGKLEPLARARGDADARAKVEAALHQALEPGARVRLGIIEIGDLDMADPIIDGLKRRCEVVDVVRAAPTGVIGAHAGPGAWGVFYQRVRDDDPLR
ncbi:MAG: DegV family EDD domain-containing protein [Ectothiorhodospiraceae bacterium]|nr:DegV family EDD domain-containing protein [Ectothiorhodospiraceae bacterium]